jgi:hypothetical protein
MVTWSWMPLPLPLPLVTSAGQAKAVSKALHLLEVQGEEMEDLPVEEI